MVCRCSEPLGWQDAIRFRPSRGCLYAGYVAGKWLSKSRRRRPKGSERLSTDSPERLLPANAVQCAVKSEHRRQACHRPSATRTTGSVQSTGSGLRVMRTVAQRRALTGITSWLQQEHQASERGSRLRRPPWAPPSKRSSFGSAQGRLGSRRAARTVGLTSICRQANDNKANRTKASNCVSSDPDLPSSLNTSKVRLPSARLWIRDSGSAIP
ncbi:uncharacterized protein C8Q71DRAFT_409358 [Rhodofomes roseus]|uniref:Uncharacterized protein n=1 Tax=Rhodofomes roseus TaxID=34475 RepID=A0ABQ8JYS6_9APHY|nr:uncharacterized protein C8Q71DRAFT_409358 [Rhodofomes roseus]KAH9829380.1 hypothetical protein C8Q71DRAFT_409358 [Rhodofomes roseus]